MIEDRIIVAGSRNYDCYDLLEQTLLNNIKISDNTVIVSGMANGADKLGERFAREYAIKLMQFPANWNLYGKRAGYLRNEQMAQYASEANGILFAFWDGESRGTEHMIKIARQYGLTVHVIEYTEE